MSCHKSRECVNLYEEYLLKTVQPTRIFLGLFGKRYQMMQEDAHEFLITLINKMNVEFSKYFIYEGG